MFETIASEDPSARQRLTALSQVGDMFSKFIFDLNPLEEDFDNVKTVLEGVWPRMRGNALALLVRHSVMCFIS